MARLSYKGKLIAQVEGQDYPLEVYENWRFRWLSFGSRYIQTVINKRKPQKPVLNYVKAFCMLLQHNPCDSVLFGVGGGAVLHYLSSLIPQQHVTAVEISSQVIELAKTYFYLSKLNNAKIVIADASAFIQEYHRPIPNLLIDLYQSENYPVQCSSFEFFYECYKRLEEGGIVSLNIVEYKQQKPLIDLLAKVFKQQIMIVPVQSKSNIIIHAIKNDSILTVANQLREKKFLRDVQWIQEHGLVGFI
jgi:spermidine synthase